VATTGSGRRPARRQHGRADFEIGDLHILFDAAFGLLSLAQRRRFFRLPEIADLLDTPEYENLRGIP
jgi:hypothetical protein